MYIDPPFSPIQVSKTRNIGKSKQQHISHLVVTNPGGFLGIVFFFFFRGGGWGGQQIFRVGEGLQYHPLRPCGKAEKSVGS